MRGRFVLRDDLRLVRRGERTPGRLRRRIDGHGLGLGRVSGDLQIVGTELHVRLDPASAPRRSKALAALCTELNDTETRYPGTDLTLVYSVKQHLIHT